MRIYIAAPYFARNYLRDSAFQLDMAGHQCTSTWLAATHEVQESTLGIAPAMDDQYAMEHATEDYEDVLRSDALVLVTWDTARELCPADTVTGPNSGGRHVETGMALAQGIPVIVWGHAENIFHRGPGVVLAPLWIDVVRELDAVQAARFGKPVPGPSGSGSATTESD